MNNNERGGKKKHSCIIYMVQQEKVKYHQVLTSNDQALQMIPEDRFYEGNFRKFESAWHFLRRDGEGIHGEERQNITCLAGKEKR